jgi:hypothetical protein
MTKLEELTVEYVRLLDKQSEATRLPDEPEKLEKAIMAVRFSLTAIKDYVHRNFAKELKG